MFTLREVLSNLANAAVVAGTLATAAFATPSPTAYVQHNGFSCVRPSYVETFTVDDNGPHTTKEFAGYRLCHEQLPVDKNGYLLFPEA
jgi:hypothetical protein